MSANGSNARLDRIERLIQQSELASKELHEENKKFREENKKFHEENRKAHEENRKAHVRMNDDLRKTDLNLRRWAALGVKEARRHRKWSLEIDEKITLLAAAQLVTEEKLQQFISNMGRGQNGAKH